MSVHNHHIISVHQRININININITINIIIIINNISRQVSKYIMKRKVEEQKKQDMNQECIMLTVCDDKASKQGMNEVRVNNGESQVKSSVWRIGRKQSSPTLFPVNEERTRVVLW